MNTIKNIYRKNETYWKVIFWVSFIYGYILGFIQALQAVAETDSVIFILIIFMLWNVIALIQAIISGVLGTIFWGALLFIPYKIIQFIVGVVKRNEIN